MGPSSSWPSQQELDRVRKNVATLAGCQSSDVRVVVSPYRICPLGAHIDHQGGIVSAMTINKGIILGFVPSSGPDVLLQSGQFKGEVRFRVDEIQECGCQNPTTKIVKREDVSDYREECSWGVYAKGALYALQRSGRHINKGIVGFICGTESLESSGLSSSAAVGIAYLLALEAANDIIVSPLENIEYDRLIENEFLGLRNGILDQSAILLSRSGCLTCMNCKTKEYSIISSPTLEAQSYDSRNENFKILVALSGLKQALTSNPGYNCRVSECQSAAKALLHASGKGELDPLLCNVSLDEYKTYKDNLDPDLAKRAEHYFSENIRVTEGLNAWRSGNLREFGRLVSASGLSSIQNYECGCKPLVQLYETMVEAPGVYGARFSGAGFRGCCIGFVSADQARKAAAFVSEKYRKLQQELAGQLSEDTAVLICEAGDGARVLY